MFNRGIIADCLELPLFFVGLYYVAAAVFSLMPPRAVRKGDALEFAVIIPAYNEESVIASAVYGVLSGTYPRDKVRVYVVCDNCTDKTASAAAAAGARIITKSDGRPNKALALRYGAERIFEEYEPDCVTVLDADNRMGEDFLWETARIFTRGYGAVQGRIEAKNPDENRLTAAYTLWECLEERMGRLAPYNIGLNVKLSGTGYSVRSEIFKKISDIGESLAEDLEYTAQMALLNEKTGYARDAVVFDEKPRKLRDSILQRIRWSRGIVTAQGKYGGRLLRRGKISDWLSLYGDFLGVFAYVFFGAISIFASLDLFGGGNFLISNIWTKVLCFIVLEIYVGLGLLTALLGIVLERKSNRSVPISPVGVLIYTVTWIPAGLIGLLTHHKKEWYHTEHKGSGE